MFSYSDILKKAYHITIQNSLFWLFGLFIAGSFNLNFLHFQDLNLSLPQAEIEFYKTLFFLQANPGALAFISLGILLGTIFSIVLTNWSRIMLIMSTNLYLEKAPYSLKKQTKQSGKLLWRVIKISLITSFLIFLAAFVLLVPAVFLVQASSFRIFLWILGAIIFLPLVFTISSINIFGAFFAVILNLKTKKALNLASDFLVCNWVKILGMAIILMLIYLTVFIAGLGLTFLIKLTLNSFFNTLASLGIFKFSGIIVIIRLISGVLLWLVAAGLNVFFNTALLLLFLDLAKPKKHPLVKAETAPNPVY